jgi:predicted ATPase
MLNILAISGYRSLRNIVLDLGSINIVTGPNGVGKSSVYRALHLLANIAQGRIIHALAQDGGLPSTLWAGPERYSRSVIAGEYPIQGTVRQSTVSLKLGFSSDIFGYAIELGLPAPSPTLFYRDPEIKTEAVWQGDILNRRSAFAERRGPTVKIRGGSDWRMPFQPLSAFDSMMTHCIDPENAPELLMLRERMRSWRFYDHLRTDKDAPARKLQIGTHTPVLAGDGADLAAAIQTIQEIGDSTAFDEAIDDAFPQARIEIEEKDGYFEALMYQRGLLRPLKTAELSDGTLRYILLTTALLSPRPPELMVLNEPESSLHPDLLPSLARLIIRSAKRSQIILVSHSDALIAALEANYDVTSIVLAKRLGETVVETESQYHWKWPTR